LAFELASLKLGGAKSSSRRIFYLRPALLTLDEMPVGSCVMRTPIGLVDVLPTGAAGAIV